MWEETFVISMMVMFFMYASLYMVDMFTGYFSSRAFDVDRVNLIWELLYRGEWKEQPRATLERESVYRKYANADYSALLLSENVGGFITIAICGAISPLIIAHLSSINLADFPMLTYQLAVISLAAFIQWYIVMTVVVPIAVNPYSIIQLTPLGWALLVAIIGGLIPLIAAVLI